VPILAVKAVKKRVDNVLIVGGGDGGCIREVLKHPKLVCTMVEIDPGVIELSRKHLPNHHAGAFDSKRARIVIADGARFVKETAERFDVIIIDSTDPVGPGAVLFTEEFYADCKRCLAPWGVLVTQNGVPYLQGPELQSSVGAFRKLFREGTCYLAVVPTYNGGFMALGWATDNAKLRKTPLAKIARLYKGAKLDTRYFTPDLFAGAFALPNFIQKLVDSAAPKKKAGKAKAGRNLKR
ncbi:MAG: polyamine aminopropyltransferase, partial [Alphaproteobacteria bacterium]